MKENFHFAMYVVAAALFAIKSFGYGKDSRIELLSLGLAVLTVALMPW